MCKITLVINNTVIMDKIIFWVLWWSTSQCSSWQHGQSRRTKIQDTPNIRLDKTKIHGSIHSGMYSVCATSGANSPTIPNTIGNTQHNKCGNTVAIIPNFTVEEDGSLTNIHIEKSVSERLDKEAKRIVSKMPKWQPAQSGGVNVKSGQTVRVNFSLQ